MATPEGLIRNAIMSWLKFRKIKCFIHDSVGIYDVARKKFRVRHGVHRTKGVPDIIAVLRPTGRLIGIECKSKTGRVSPEQKAWLDGINEDGGLAFVARSIKDVETQLSPLLSQGEKW